MIPDAIAAVAELPGNFSVQSCDPFTVTRGGIYLSYLNMSCPYVTAMMAAHFSVYAGSVPSQFTPDIAMVWMLFT